MMKAYPEYKDSNLPWLGDVPNHWKVNKFKNIFKLEKRSVNEQDGVVTAFRDGEVTLRTNRRTSGFTNSVKETGYQGVRKGDLVVHAMDAFAGAIGVSDSDGKCTPVYSCCTPKANQSSYYYSDLLRVMSETGFIQSLSKGIRERSTEFRWADLSIQYLPEPPTEEQEDIVRFLASNIKRINGLISEKQNFIKLLSEKRQALIHQAICDQKTELIRLKYCADKVSRTITREDESEYEPVGIYNRARGIFSKGYTLGKDLGDSDFGYIKTSDLIISGQFAWEGSVSIVTSEFDGCVASHRYHIYKGKNGILDTDYLWAYLTTSKGDFVLNECSRGSAGRNRPLNSRLLELEEIPVPPMEIQLKIKKMVEIEREIKKEAKIFKSYLKEHRTALISAAVTGKIDVREMA